jgi:ApaG protein
MTNSPGRLPDPMFQTTTNGVVVRVWTTFVPQHSDPSRSQFSWQYTVELENQRPDTVQLISRHWLITDGTKRVEVVKGPGVVGEQPVLKPGETFNYTSGCRLGTPTGSMRGSYQIVTADGEEFEARVPPFPLRTPN